MVHTRTHPHPLQAAVAQGGRVLVGGSVRPGKGNFVDPTIIEISHSAPVVRCEALVCLPRMGLPLDARTHPFAQVAHELFAPVLYAVRVRSLEEAVALNNSVPQVRAFGLVGRDVIWFCLIRVGFDFGLI